MKYQPEVDGLRALAVLPVLLFHARVTGFTGGFVGVDVFFVISGYLITGILRDDLEKGRFSIIHFYERRVRRIIPALMATIAGTLLAGVVLFLPYQLTALSFAALNAVTFTSNIWFWRQTGYFAGTDGLDPLLHTWSLAVEEQFYLVFPIVLYLLHRVRMQVAGVGAAWILSFITAVFLVDRMPSAAFYLIPARAWELMTGAILALGVFPRVQSRPAREVMAVTGILMILVPVYLYTEETAFPGLAAMPPCLGTFLVILAGRSGSSTATDLLSRKTIVGIGLISYSLYLWHWPILVFARQWSIQDLSPLATAACLAASFVLAWLSWRFVEQPFRDRRRLSRKQVFQYGASFAAVVGSTALLVSGGLPERLDARAKVLAGGHLDRPATVDACLSNQAELHPCALGAKGTPNFVVWGDSHAAALGEAVGEVASRQLRTGQLYAFNACPPGSPEDNPFLSNVDREHCLKRNRLIEDFLVANEHIKTVILIAYWQNYWSRSEFELLRGLQGVVSRMCAAGKDVTIVTDLPLPPYDVPLATAISAQFGRPLSTTYPAPARDIRLAALAQQTGARTVPLSPIICPDGRCQTVRHNRPLFFDTNHVTAFANKQIIAPGLDRSGLFASATGSCQKPRSQSARVRGTAPAGRSAG